MMKHDVINGILHFLQRWSPAERQTLFDAIVKQHPDLLRAPRRLDLADDAATNRVDLAGGSRR